MSRLPYRLSQELPDLNKEYLKPFLGKKYILYYSQNFDKVMQEMGAGSRMRMMGRMAKPVLTLKEEAGDYTLSLKSPLVEYEARFKFGIEFSNRLPDGRQVKRMFVQHGSRITLVELGNSLVVEREFSEEEVIVTIKLNELISIRKYKRL